MVAETALTHLEKLIVQTTLDTTTFVRRQMACMERDLQREAAKDGWVPLLAQLPGVNILTALTILAAIGVIERLECPKWCEYYFVNVPLIPM